MSVPILPNAAARAAGLFFLVVGAIVAISATVTVSPIWLYGPSSPGDASAGSRPDWYTGFLDGALRLVPPGWEFVWLDRIWTLAILAPLAVVTLFLLLVVAYPFIEGWITGDHREHHLLDRPRNVPTRTAIGVAGIAFYGALWGAGSAALAATQLHSNLGGRGECGQVPWSQRVRYRLSRFFFEDRIRPVTPAELETDTAHPAGD